MSNSKAPIEPNVDVYETIDLISDLKSGWKKMCQEEREKHEFINIISTPHHPLLKDYNWVYEHAEELFRLGKRKYTNNQGVEEYHTLFLAITTKYPLDEDYDKYLTGEMEESALLAKWTQFAKKLIDFLNSCDEDFLPELLAQDTIISYIFKYPIIFTREILSRLNLCGFEKLLEFESFASFYRHNIDDLIFLIKSNSGAKIPAKMMREASLVKKISRTYDVFDFYHNLKRLLHRDNEQVCIDEHKKYCDEQADKIDDGILPCLMNEYNSAPAHVTFPNSIFKSKYLSSIQKRIFEEHEATFLSKKELFQGISKYVLLGLFMSRYYETNPSDLLADIETIYRFKEKHNRPLKGFFVYEFLINSPSMSVFEITDFYRAVQHLPLQEMFYDDWRSQKESLVEEINASLLDPTTLKLETDESGKSYYDITDVASPILVSNTLAKIYNTTDQVMLIEQIKSGEKDYICMSLQDDTHQVCFKYNGVYNTIKLVYGPLDPHRVGIIHHKDICSSTVDSSAVRGYKFRLYTLKDLMDKTTDYNEITYAIKGEPFLPIGILCEDEITESEYAFAQVLNISVFLRTQNSIKRDASLEKEEENGKKYTIHPLV